MRGEIYVLYLTENSRYVCQGLFAEAISHLPNQEIASPGNARNDYKNYVLGNHYLIQMFAVFLDFIALY